LFYRGITLTPRDLFDWRMIELRLPSADLHVDRLAVVLSDKLDGIASALQALSRVAPDNLRWAGIRTPYPLDLQETVAWARERVEALRAIAASGNRL
jgi:hypothetical protein